MSEQPVVKDAPAGRGLNLNALIKKRFLNIPVLYWALGFVAVLAVLAWQMKPSPDVEAEDAAEDDMTDEYDTAGALAEQYPDMPTGTVIVAPQPVEQDPSLDNQSIPDNETWLKRGVAFLITRGNTATNAQSALQEYLEGNDLSFTQSTLVSTVIGEIGMPPVAPAIGTTKADIARQQGPLPLYHTVKGVSDNSVAKIANLYYGSGSAKAGEAAIKAEWSFRTRHKGRDSNYPVGTTVYVPMLPTPKTVSTITSKKTTPHVAGRYTIRQGNKGKTVAYAQWKLGLPTNARFDSKMTAAVKAYQRKHGIKPDGVIGPSTWKKLDPNYTKNASK